MRGAEIVGPVVMRTWPTVVETTAAAAYGTLTGRTAGVTGAIVGVLTAVRGAGISAGAAWLGITPGVILVSAVLVFGVCGWTVLGSAAFDGVVSAFFTSGLVSVFGAVFDFGSVVFGVSAAFFSSTGLGAV